MFNSFKFNQTKFNSCVLTILIPIIGSKLIGGGSPGRKRKRIDVRKVTTLYNVVGLKQFRFTKKIDILGKKSTSLELIKNIKANTNSNTSKLLNIFGKLNSSKIVNILINGKLECKKQIEYSIQGINRKHIRSWYSSIGSRNINSVLEYNVNSITQSSENRINNYECSGISEFKKTRDINLSGRKDIIQILEVLDLI